MKTYKNWSNIPFFNPGWASSLSGHGILDGNSDHDVKANNPFLWFNLYMAISVNVDKGLMKNIDSPVSLHTCASGSKLPSIISMHYVSARDD